jgi:hypothetical protein
MYKERKVRRIYALFLAVIMVIAMAVPSFALEKAKDIKITITVNNKGILATAKDGSAMVEKEVTVSDLDSSGDISYDEALVAVHKAYCPTGAAGYAWETKKYTYEGQEYEYIAVTKLWGVETTNDLFFDNDEGISPDVISYTVKDGDKLYASVNADEMGTDYKTKFDITSKTATVNDKITVVLTGRVGMSYDKDAPLEGIKLGYWEKGAFKEISGAVTDAKGQATFTVDKEGDFILTAKGTIKTKDWEGKDALATTMAPYCILKVNPAPQKTQTVTAKAKTISLKYKSVKKKKATIKASKITKGNKASTKISYKLVKVNKSKSKSKFKVASDGKITVKKGTKKGTYKLTIKASAVETKEYKAASKNFKVTIKIK